MKTETKLTGYPSIDKPWLKYYSEEEISAPLPKCTLYEHLYRSNKDHPDDIAINYYDRKITYRQLLENIQHAADSFTALGVKPGEIVIICSVNIPETLYAFYALNQLGAIANMVDPRTNVPGVHQYITESNTRFIISVDAAYPLIIKAAENTDVQKIIAISPADSLPLPAKMLYTQKNKPIKYENNTISWKTFLEQGKGVTASPAPYQKDRCCVIAHTGGTTGAPKGVMLSDDNINAISHGYRFLGIPFQRKQRYFDDLPPFIMFGLVLATHTTLCYGFEVILYPVFDSKGFPKQFAKYKPHHISALPDHLKYMMEDEATKNIDLSEFISPAVGGDALNAELESAFNQYLKRQNCKYEVTNGYGMTELSTAVCTTCPKAYASGSVGIPLVMNTIKIMDVDTMQELPYNQIGEIWINSPTIMLGYYNMKKETDDIIITDENGTRWIRTGDLGRINEDGILFHEGRIRRIYLTSHDGQPAKIFPMLIEDKLKEHEAVFDAVVVARLKPGSANYESVAFVILNEGKTWTEELKSDLENVCQKGTPSYMWPVEYRVVTEFPHTPIGKVDFRKLESEISNIK